PRPRWRHWRCPALWRAAAPRLLVPPRRVRPPRPRRPPPRARPRRGPAPRPSRVMLPAAGRPAASRPAAGPPTAAHITARTCEQPCLLGVTSLVGHAGRRVPWTRLLVLGGYQHQAAVDD